MTYYQYRNMSHQGKSCDVKYGTTGYDIYYSPNRSATTADIHDIAEYNPKQHVNGNIKHH